MTSRFASIASACVVLSALLYVQAAAAAGSVCPAPPTQESEAKALASTWFSLGEQLVKHEAFSEAVAAFECSLSMVVHPATLYNAGQAAILAGDKRKALSFFEQYLARAKPYDDLTEDVENRTRQLRSELGNENELIGPGPAQQEGSGDETTPASAEVDGRFQDSSQRRGASSKDWLNRPLAIASFSVAGAAAALGLAFNIAAANRLGAGNDAKSWTDFQRIDDDLRTYQAVAIVGYATAAVAFASGVVFLWRGKKVQTSPVSVAPSVRGVTLQLTF